MTRAQRSSIALAWMCAVASACGDDASRSTLDAGHDASPLDASLHLEAGTDAEEPFDNDAGGLPLCPISERLDDCNDPTNPVGVLVEATRFGFGAELQAVEGSWLLVRGGNFPSQVVRVRTSWGGETLVFSDALPGSARAIDVVDSADEGHVLACDDASCQVWRAIEDRNDLRLDPLGPPLPTTLGLRGITRGRAHDPISLATLPCVFGQGIHCFDGTQWGAALADQTLVSVAIGRPSVAITDTGDVWTSDLEPVAWRRITELDGQALDRVDTFIDGAGMPSKHDRWTWLFANGTYSQCALGRPFDVIRVVDDGSDQRMIGITHDQRFVHWSRYESFTYCSSATLSRLATDPAFDLAVEVCGVMPNARILTATALIGQASCAIE